MGYTEAIQRLIYPLKFRVGSLDSVQKKIERQTEKHLINRVHSTYTGWQGLYGIAAFAALNSFVVYVYASRWIVCHNCHLSDSGSCPRMTISNFWFRWSSSANQTILTRLLFPPAKVNNDHEETFEFIKEGFMGAFAVFMVSWFTHCELHKSVTCTYHLPQLSWQSAYQLASVSLDKRKIKTLSFPGRLDHDVLVRLLLRNRLYWSKMYILLRLGISLTCKYAIYRALSNSLCTPRLQHWRPQAVSKASV